MKVIILAGGRSERMRPIEEKPLLKICGKPMVVQQIEIISGVGLKDFIIVGSKVNLPELREIGEQYRRTRQDISIEYTQQVLAEGSAGAMKSAEHLLSGEPVLIVCANDILGIDAYRQVMSTVENEPGKSVFLANKVSTYFPGGYVVQDEEGHLQHIEEKPGEGNEPSDLMNIFVHYHPDGGRMMEYVHKATTAEDDIYLTALDMMVAEQHKIRVVPYEGSWQAIKYPWHVYDECKVLMRKEMAGRSGVVMGADVEIGEGVVLKGDVILGDGVKVLEGAIVTGPTFIGAGSVIANHAMVRESFIGENCVIGFGSEITRSYLGDRVRAHKNYIGDSVIGNNVSFGAGTVTGNLRLDEGNVKVTIKDSRVNSGRKKFGIITGNNVRIGVNCSIMPGVKIGSNCVVGPGVLLSEDLESDQYVKQVAANQVRKNLVDVSSLENKKL